MVMPKSIPAVPERQKAALQSDGATNQAMSMREIFAVNLHIFSSAVLKKLI